MAEQENTNVSYLQISTLEHNEQISMIVDKLNELVQHINALENLGAELLVRVSKLENEVDDFESTDFASHDHYHDEYANIDHVERSENSLERKISRVEESVNNLEYRVNDAERKVERAQSTADNAARQSRGGW